MEKFNEPVILKESEIIGKVTREQLESSINKLYNSYYGWKTDFITIVRNDIEIIEQNQIKRFESLQKYKNNKGIYNLPPDEDRYMEYYQNLRESIEQFIFVFEVFEECITNIIEAEKPYYSITGKEFRDKLFLQFYNDINDEVDDAFANNQIKIDRALQLYEENEKFNFIDLEIKKIRDALYQSKYSNHFPSIGIEKNFKKCLENYFLTEIYGRAKGIEFDVKIKAGQMALRRDFLVVAPKIIPLIPYPIFKFNELEREKGLIDYIVNIKLIKFLKDLKIKIIKIEKLEVYKLEDYEHLKLHYNENYQYSFNNHREGKFSNIPIIEKASIYIESLRYTFPWDSYAKGFASEYQKGLIIEHEQKEKQVLYLIKPNPYLPTVSINGEGKRYFDKEIVFKYGVEMAQSFLAWQIVFRNLSIYEEYFIKSISSNLNILTFKTTLKTPQLKNLFEQLVKPENSFIAADTELYNWFHVFGEPISDGKKFEPIKWIKLNRHSKPHQSALLELLTLILGKTPNQKTLEKLITDKKGNVIILGKLNKTKPSKCLGDFEKWTDCTLI